MVAMLIHPDHADVLMVSPAPLMRNPKAYWVLRAMCLCPPVLAHLPRPWWSPPDSIGHSWRTLPIAAVMSVNIFGHGMALSGTWSSGAPGLSETSAGAGSAPCSMKWQSCPCWQVSLPGQ